VVVVVPIQVLRELAEMVVVVQETPVTLHPAHLQQEQLILEAEGVELRGVELVQTEVQV
jgi:hypothetical protein